MLPVRIQKGKNVRTWKLIIYGRVQGVGYRNSIYNFIHQNTLPITGHVRNLSNDTVEIVVQGDIDDMRKVEDFSAIGSKLSEVTNIDKIEINEDEKYPDFNIRY